jgi:outer membrane autotransporter protein
LPPTGLIREKFVQNPANTIQFGVLQTVDKGATQVAGLSTLAGALSSMLDEPVGAYVTNRTDGAHIGLWLRGSAGNIQQNLSSVYTATGFSDTVTDRVSTRFRSLQGGLDFGLGALGGGGDYNLHFGITGGAFDGLVRGSQASTDIDGSFIGGYVSLIGRGLQIDTTIRKEWRHYVLTNPNIFVAGMARTKGTATAGSVDASYKINLGNSGFAVTPSASYAWGSSNVDAFGVDTLSTFTPGKDHQGTGRFGAKFSWSDPNATKLVVEPYVAAYAVHNFSNTESSTATFGVSAIQAVTTSYKDGILYSVGVGLHDTNNHYTFFMRGNAYRGGGLGGESVSGGIRINF